MFKFVRSEKDAEKEAKNWALIYGNQFSVRAEKWMQDWVVIMPRFKQFRTAEDRTKNIDKVKSCLTSNFASQNLKHADVKWRNIGYYLKNNEVCVVVFDLARLEKENDKVWVESCMIELKKRI